MKISNLKRWGIGGALVGALALGGCGSMSSMRGEQTWTMSTTEKIPSAEGKVKVAKTKEGNTKLKVEVAHLAQPDAAFENASTYVVWIKPQSGEAKTAFKTFEVLVTAERSANVMSPHGQSVMDTRIVVPT